MRNWLARFAPDAGEATTLEQLQEENKRLRRSLKRAELEREILKKATAFFAQEST
jgi:transposase